MERHSLGLDTNFGGLFLSPRFGLAMRIDRLLLLAGGSLTIIVRDPLRNGNGKFLRRGLHPVAKSGRQLTDNVAGGERVQRTYNVVSEHLS